MRIRMRFPDFRAMQVVAGVGCAMAAAIPSLAQAADCSTLTHPVYIAGSTAVKPFLAAIAKSLIAANPPITVIYSSQGSCVGVTYMTASPAGTIGGTPSIWDSTGTESTCTADVAGNQVDIGVSDVYPSTCPSPNAPANGVKDFHGPIQSMTFAVPLGSQQQQISVEAAYMVFGFGADTAAHTVAPWNDATALEVRSASSGTQQMISAALAQVGSGFVAAKVKGVSNASGGAVLTGLTALANANNQEKAIGFLAMDVVDSNRASVRPLAFQFVGQSCGYTPDSDPTKWDKQNVRDGHYAIWGPLHMLTPVGSDGKATNPDAQTIISLLSGAPTVDLIAVEATKGVVPDCAMRVSRTSEVGAMASYMPPHSCECKFLADATGATSCQVCTTANGTTSSECTDPAKKVCNYGYCEVQ